MTEGQWWGVAIIAIGVYFLVCSIWARGFVLYRFKISRFIAAFGDKYVHHFYGLIGLACLVAGILQATEIWIVES